MYSYLNSESFLKDLANLARHEKRYSDHGHSYYLEQIAKFSGFRPWSSLRDAIKESGNDNLHHWVSEDLVNRVCSGLEKAVPNSVLDYALMDAKRFLEHMDMSQRSQSFLGAEKLRDFIEEYYGRAFSSELLDQVIIELSSDGMYLYQEDPILDFQTF